MATKNQPSSIIPCYDRNRRTCIQVERTAGCVKFIPLDVTLGLEVHSASADSFDQRFTPMEEYPVKKACQLFVNYSQTLGATKEAMDYLGQIINVSKQEFQMATAKKRTIDKKPSAACVPAKSTAKKAVVKPTKAKPAEKPAKSGEKKTSAAQMFQELIMAGKLTDSQIFQAVQAKFGLDEKKRGYVKWYRSHLKKSGANPPEAKAEK